jgi:hypothetical protein
MKNHFWALGILALVVSMVAISGCTSTQKNSTYTDNAMSFNYPADIKNSTVPGSIISAGTGWENVAFLHNNKVAIFIKKNKNSNNSTNARDATNIQFKENSGQVLSTTEEINPNGIEVSRSILTLTDPNTDTLLKYYNMFFNDNGVYYISVYGNNSTTQQIHETANTVFNSLKTN